MSPPTPFSYGSLCTRCIIHYQGTINLCIHTPTTSKTRPEQYTQQKANSQSKPWRVELDADILHSTPKESVDENPIYPLNWQVVQTNLNKLWNSHRSWQWLLISMLPPHRLQNREGLLQNTTCQHIKLGIVGSRQHHSLCGHHSQYHQLIWWGHSSSGGYIYGFGLHTEACGSPPCRAIGIGI